MGCRKAGEWFSFFLCVYLYMGCVCLLKFFWFYFFYGRMFVILTLFDFCVYACM